MHSESAIVVDVESFRGGLCFYPGFLECGKRRLVFAAEGDIGSCELRVNCLARGAEVSQKGELCVGLDVGVRNASVEWMPSADSDSPVAPVGVVVHCHKGLLEISPRFFIYLEISSVAESDELSQGGECPDAVARVVSSVVE